MDTAETRRILDSLDRRLALGEIDIGTYNQLKAKFSAELDSPEDPLSAILGALSKEASALKCPGCMAPLLLPSDLSLTSVVCEYCGGTFALQAATEEMEHLKDDIRKWIAEVAGTAGVGTTVDEASRRFIFQEKLLPSLRVGADRATEMFSMIRYQSLFSFPLLDHLPSSSFHQAVQSTPDLNHLVDRVKSTVARVQSPEIEVFVVGDKGKADLYTLEVQCQETVYISNARRHLLSFSADGMQKARTNLQALTDLYGRVSSLSSAVESSLAKFSSGLVTRLTAVEEAVGILGHLQSNPEGVMIDQIAANLESAAVKCEQALAQIESAGRQPKEQVPAAEGTRTDAQTIRLLASCVKLFGDCGGEAGESFTSFLTALGEMVDCAKESSSDLTWLSGLLAHLVRQRNTTSEEGAFPVVYDFSWVDSRALSSIHSSLFGGKESVEAEKQLFLPFWVAELNFSQQRGVIFKKGRVAETLLFLDATRHSEQCFAVPLDDPLSGQCYNAGASSIGIDAEIPKIVPVVNAEHALSRMKRFVSSTEGYIGGHVKLLNIYYLPAVVVRYYTKKKERTEVLLPSGSIQIKPFQSKKIQLGISELMLVQ